MNNHGITVENLMSAFPASLQEDKDIVALAQSISEKLVDRVGEINNVLIYPRVDELPEKLLDLLAYDLNVSWYDYNWSVEAKAEAIRNSVTVHRMMGTKAAVELAVSTLTNSAVVEEWFEYGGDPYRFRVIVYAYGETAFLEDYNALLNRIQIVKNARSHLDEIRLREAVGFGTTLYLGTVMSEHTITEIECKSAQEEIYWLEDGNGNLVVDNDGVIFIL